MIVGIMAGIASTDWSWTPLVADFDLDGHQDLIVTNGFPKDITNLDFSDYYDDVYYYCYYYCYSYNYCSYLYVYH